MSARFAVQGAAGVGDHLGDPAAGNAFTGSGHHSELIFPRMTLCRDFSLQGDVQEMGS